MTASNVVACRARGRPLGTKRPRIKHRRWREADLATLRSEYPHTLTIELALRFGRTRQDVYNKAFTLGLKKSDEFNATLAGRFDHGNAVGPRYQPGNRPHNKGVKGWFPLGSLPEHLREVGRELLKLRFAIHEKQA